MAHLMDSSVYGSSWATPALKLLFDDVSMTRHWLEIMVVLAEIQAEYDLIPKTAATGIKQTVENLVLDDIFFAQVASGYSTTNHSLLGLIHVVSNHCPEDSGEWICYGVTVQDITDTRHVLVLKQFHDCIADHLTHIKNVLRQLCSKHRDTLMCGRTHGQAGLPITFGYKSAVWLDEFYRHHQRLQELNSRLFVAQLCGGVGSLSSLGEHAIQIQQAFSDKLGLNRPDISWTCARDRFAEWLNLLSLMTSTCDRIGKEIYNLQRPEIDELREGFKQGNVGSITMPQKRNPELSEHIGTLARIVRHGSAQLNEALIHDHERDGRAWKTEWIVLPEACLAAEKAINLTHQLLGNLTVNSERMQTNMNASGGSIFAEAVMLAIAPDMGKQTAHTLVYQLAMFATENNQSFQQAVKSDPTISTLLSAKQIDAIFNIDNLTTHCADMVDAVLAKEII